MAGLSTAVLGASLRVVAALLALTVLAGACGGGDQKTAGRPGKEVKPLSQSFVPPEVLGLKATSEPAEQYVAEVDRNYLEEFGLYSFREGDLLQATLQVSKFGSGAEYTSPSFRGALVNQIGSAKAQVFRMGETEVHLTTGTKQQISIWFKDRYMFVLSVRDDYIQPRTLLRRALEFTP